MPLESSDPRPGSPEFADRLLQSARPFRRGEEIVTRGRQRPPMLVVRPPAYAAATAYLVRLVGDVAQHRNIATRRPEAFRVQYSEDLMVIILTPVERYDPQDPELIPARWSPNGRRLSVNLLEILQPRRMTVPRGMVMEIPVMAVELTGLGAVLLCLLGQHQTRPVRDRGPAAPAGHLAAAEAHREAAAGQQVPALPPAPGPTAEDGE